MRDDIILPAIDHAMANPLCWGGDDCCLWAADIVLAHTGIDIARPLRGYRSRFGAAKALYIYAGGGLTEAAIKRARNLELDPIARPFRGDAVAVVASRNGPFLAVLWRSHWVGRSTGGVEYYPLWHAVAAWRWPS